MRLFAVTRAAVAVAVAAVLLAGPPARAQARNSKWQATIDSMWGPGLPTDQKLQLFDTFWNTVDQQYAGFSKGHDKWAQLRGRYRPEVAAGVSRGRFAAIMSQLTLAVQDGHTFAFDLGVVQQTRDPAPGVPVFVFRGRPQGINFGACVTALPDGSALVYNVAAGHPLGLAPGDRILGYDGRPWRAEVRELLGRDQLPMRGNLSTNRVSTRHLETQSAAVNWHLFTTIDIRKHDSGRVVHLPTAALNTTPPLSSPVCTEGLPQPGVPQPSVVSSGAGTTWGTITGTDIGYIHLVAEDATGGALFAQAVNELGHTDGLIIDERANVGGFFEYGDEALSALIPGPLAGIGVAQRADPPPHLPPRAFEEGTGPPPPHRAPQHPTARPPRPKTFHPGG